MNVQEQIAKALYEAPYDEWDDGDLSPWPPQHPDDRGWWLSRADAVLPFLGDNMLDSQNDNDQKEVPND